MKKTMALLLALIMVFALAVPAMAAGEGSITINNAVVGQTYDLYKILDLTVDKVNAPTAYKYTVNSVWKDFFTSGADGLKYVTIDSTDGHVVFKDGVSAADFAADAKAFAVENKIATVKSTKATSGTVAFTGLDLGYYLVVSDLGALVALDTTNPHADMLEKNSKPTDKKTVEEDATKNYGEKNDADIGQTVNFKGTIEVKDGAPKNYVFHDKMSAGLTFNASSVVVKNGETTLAAGTDYTLVTEGLTDGCTFEVRFNDSALHPNDVIVVSYSAVVNENAVIGETGNKNTSKLTYTDTNGNSGETTPSETKTYTWQFDLLKQNSKEEPLAGAQFTLYRDSKCTDAISLVEIDNETYRVAKTGETGVTVITTPESGKLIIQGLDSDTYYLKEIKAPDGYNLLKDPIKVVIDDQGNVTYNEGKGSGTVTVVNLTGSELPSTGGIGTTIFYVVGGLLMLGAVVVLVTRKKVHASK